MANHFRSCFQSLTPPHPSPRLQRWPVGKSGWDEPTTTNKTTMSNGRFCDYREIRAKFNSTGNCGHEIKTGDMIGWHRAKGCKCKDCWAKWVAENREAEALECGWMNNACM